MHVVHKHLNNLYVCNILAFVFPCVQYIGNSPTLVPHLMLPKLRLRFEKDIETTKQNVSHKIL